MNHKIKRLLDKSVLLIKLHLINPFRRPRSRRHAMRIKYLHNYLKFYVSAADSVSSTIVCRDAEDKIFSIWLQGEENAPEIIKACFRSMRANFSQELVVLDSNTLQEYIDLPDFIMEKYRKGKISHAHFSDICRVELLHKYGGLWIDATCFATGPIPQEIIDEDFLMTRTRPGDAFSYSFIQNCFIRARKGSWLLEAWRAMMLEYWKHENKVADYFVHQCLFEALVTENPKAAMLFSQMPDIWQGYSHALWWGYADKPFDMEEFKRITGDFFFQKIGRKTKAASQPLKGSFAEAMIKTSFSA